jgi:NAD(P)-dependent dehydrogenase (short-subunit alcohol dehydrogenase family)
MKRVALVTGASRGIGSAIATRLESDGLEVVRVDRIETPNAPAQTITFDLQDLQRLDDLLSAIESVAPEVDVLVNNAAIAVPTPPEALDIAELRDVLAVNLEAPLLLAARLGGRMAERGWGRIIMVSSIHARLGEQGSVAYDVAKAGLEQAARTLAVEYGRRGVLVNAVAPGFVKTGMSIVDGKDETEGEWFKTVFVKHGRLPLGRASQPEEIAAVVSWLASEDNTYVTGETVIADGGLSGAL